MAMEKSEKRPRRKFTGEFKRRAVVLENVRRPSHVARRPETSRLT